MVYIIVWKSHNIYFISVGVDFVQFKLSSPFWSGIDSLERMKEKYAKTDVVKE